MEKQKRREEREKEENIGESKRTNQPRKRTENTTRMKTNKHTLQLGIREARSEERHARLKTKRDERRDDKEKKGKERKVNPKLLVRDMKELRWER